MKERERDTKKGRGGEKGQAERRERARGREIESRVGDTQKGQRVIFIWLQSALYNVKYINTNKVNNDHHHHHHHHY